MCKDSQLMIFTLMKSKSSMISNRRSILMFLSLLITRHADDKATLHMRTFFNVFAVRFVCCQIPVMLTFLQCGPLPDLTAGALIQVLVNLHANQEEVLSADWICPCHIAITEVNSRSQFAGLYARTHVDINNTCTTAPAYMTTFQGTLFN